MNQFFSQSNRLGRLNTSLGQDVLVLLRFTGDDHLNDLFQYTVEALSTQANVNFDDLIGTHATVTIETQSRGPRLFDGIVTEAKWAGSGENGHRYALTLRPWLWLASRRRNQRIFHNMSVVDILDQLFVDYSALGDPIVDNRLVNDYRPLEYTVQYRESDMTFALRLMERFGINYHFRHDEGSHTLVLTDTMVAHDPIIGDARPYKPYDGHHNNEDEHFWEWYPTRRLTTGAIRLTDYNFKSPHGTMETERTGDAAYDHGQIESYDYPGDYLDHSSGEGVAELRTDQERGQDRRHRAVGDCTSLGSGMRVTLTGDHVDGVDGQTYLCLRASHSFVSQAYGTSSDTAAQSDGYAYSGQYVLMPATAPLNPELKTQRPLVHGPQTAFVVGEGEIDCDVYGRILVRFHWDLEGAYSMRCRVSQNWASKGWGGMVIPRIGMEVVVEFLEGDPDKPLVTGCVYNGHNDVPYPLPEHKTRSTFKTDTHEGTGFNELRFEDQNGREEVFLHAEMNTNVFTKHDFSRITKRNLSSHTMGQRHEVVQRSSLLEVGRSMTVRTGDRTSGRTGLFQVPMSGDKMMQIGEKLQGDNIIDNDSPGDFEVVAAGEIELNAQSSLSGTSGDSIRLFCAENMNLDAMGRFSVDAGKNIEIGSARSISVRAAKRIHLTTGAGSITIDEKGVISIKGSQINLDASGTVNVNGRKIFLN